MLERQAAVLKVKKGSGFPDPLFFEGGELIGDRVVDRKSLVTAANALFDQPAALSLIDDFWNRREMNISVRWWAQ